MVRRKAGSTAVLYIVITVLLLQPLALSGQSTESKLKESPTVLNSLGIGQNQTIEILNWPDEFSEDLTLDVPAAEAISGIEFDLEPHAVGRTDTVIWDQQSDWSHPQATIDNVDYNKTGLRINSPPAEWGFENVDHGWILDANGGWARGTDSAGAKTGSEAIYTYQGDYPNQMSTTYWAQSPRIDCSSCSGGWELSFWKRLGVESSSWDHAYVQVKGAGGWSTIWQNSGTVIDSSYSQSTYRVDSYVAGNSDFAIRYGLGPTDFSVTYDGWNIDDISISPVAGSGTGAAKVDGSGHANWTSPAYGTGSAALYQRDPGPYGLVNIEAYLPQGTGLEWSILDATSGNPLKGYESRSELNLDIGGIDWESHPLIRLQLHLWSAAAESPIIDSISVGRMFSTDLNSDPFAEGWTGDGSWDGGQIEGDGIIYLPGLQSTSPITGVDINCVISGAGMLEYSLTGEDWIAISTIGKVDFDRLSYSLQLRWNATADWIIEAVEVFLEVGDLPLRPLIDIGKDGVAEWSLQQDAIGFWGLQDRFSDGALSGLETLSSTTTHITEFWVPAAVIKSFCLDLNPFGEYLTDLEVQLTIGQILVRESNLTGQISEYRLCLSGTELNQTNSALSSQPAIFSEGDQAFVLARLKLSGPAQRVWVSALHIPYSPIVEFELGPQDNMLLALNDELSEQAVLNGVVEVSIPIACELRGGFVAALHEMETIGGMATTNLSLANSSTPLTASWQWLELGSTHSATNGVIESIQYDFIETRNHISFQFPVTGGAYSSTGNTSLLEFDDSVHQVSFGQSSIDSLLRFRLDPNWDDTDLLEIKVRLITSAGEVGIPQILTIGGGAANGIENDVEIHSWDIRNDLGNVIPASMPFVKAGSDIRIDVQLAFEGMSPNSVQPKSGDVDVFLLENGFEVARSSTLQRGEVSFSRSIPFGPGNLTYEVGIEPLSDQVDVTSIITQRTFTADSLSPLLIDSNIARYDHRSPSSTQLFAFEIYDRPQLPPQLLLGLWAEWLHDTDGDGMPSSTEYSHNLLYSPANLSASQGMYSMVFDDTGASEGQLVYGFVTGTDVAGNNLVGGGSPLQGDELFIYQVKQDGAPMIIGTSIAWDTPGSMWLNPGINNELVLPFDEPNGISDLERVSLDLAGPITEDSLSIEWSVEDAECRTESPYLVIESCNIYSRDSAFGPFNPTLEMRLVFSLAWETPFSEQQINEPLFEVQDRQGQSSLLQLPQLRWRYSDDLMLASETLSLIPETGTQIGSDLYVRPETAIELSGEYVFSRTGLNPVSEFELEAGLGFTTSLIDLTDGRFTLPVIAPLQAGIYPLVLNLQGLPESAEDVTTFELPSVVVDDTAPSVRDVISPRPGVALDRTEVSLVIIELELQETIMMSAESITLYWMITEVDSSTSTSIYEGTIALDASSQSLSGLFEVSGLIDLSTEFARLPSDERANLHVWVVGNDAAGNPLDSTANSIDSPLASWTIESLHAELLLTDISYSKTDSISLGESITVVMSLRNTGTAPLTTNLTVFELSTDGQTEIARETVELAVGASTSVKLDWAPRSTGVLWLEIQQEGEYLGEGPAVSVSKSGSNPFSNFEGVDGSVILVFLFLICFAIVMVVIIVRGDPGDADEWDAGWEESDAEAPQSKPVAPLPQLAAPSAQPMPPPEMLQPPRLPPQ